MEFGSFIVFLYNHPTLLTESLERRIMYLYQIQIHYTNINRTNDVLLHE